MNYWEDRYDRCKRNNNIEQWWYSNEKEKAQKEIINFIGDYRPSSVLDYGCGNGNNAYLFDCEYVGYDIVSEMIKDNIEKEGVTSKKHFTTDLNSVIKNKYDLIMFVMVLQHISENEIKKIFEKIKGCYNNIIIREMAMESNDYIYYHPNLVGFLIDNGLKLYKADYSESRLLWMKP
jgi:cyclopropane fatty-acyl-phospholipid synthase-like methyltransferase